MGDSNKGARAKVNDITYIIWSKRSSSESLKHQLPTSEFMVQNMGLCIFIHIPPLSLSLSLSFSLSIYILLQDVPRTYVFWVSDSAHINTESIPTMGTHVAQISYYSKWRNVESQCKYVWLTTCHPHRYWQHYCMLVTNIFFVPIQAGCVFLHHDPPKYPSL